MRKFIATHFKRCHPGNGVLTTFPTLTFLYWMIKKSAEWIRVWASPDENPLSFSEVSLVCGQYGIKMLKNVIWEIGLTQCYLVYRKS